MASILAPTPSTSRPPVGSRRFGYVVAIVVNGAMLIVAHQLLDWQWPGFLTGDFADVLWLLSASFVTAMVVNACWLLYDQGRLRALGELVTASFGLVVSVRMWNVFPFDFSAYATDWSWLLRTALAVGIGGTAIAIIVNVVTLIRPPTKHVA